MDPRHTGEILKHLEKQNEMLVEAYNSISHEVHKLQVEEEMLMRKFYELMDAQGLNRKKESNNNVSQDAPIGHSNALLTNDSNASDGDGHGIGHCTALTAMTNEQQ
uniref:Uncharacterized protein LOC105114436 n=1 Tax=Rhizophora mucronata TaxID=61149 RepID=A0A2P2JMC6_RHIMU